MGRRYEERAGRIEPPGTLLFPAGLGFILEGNHPLVYRWVRTTPGEVDDVLRRLLTMPYGETFGVILHSGFARGGD